MLLNPDLPYIFFHPLDVGQPVFNILFMFGILIKDWFIYSMINLQA